MPAKLAMACVAPVMTIALIGCSQSSPSTSQHASASRSAAPSAASAASVDSACEHASPSAQQLTGDWTEAGESAVTTLGVDGALKSSADNDTGTWSYAPWASTPGKTSMPAGEDHRCVLWLHYQRPPPGLDLVYVPLQATSDSLKLRYVGRGNTLHWVRPHPST